MFCPKCGTANGDQAAFCSKCGAALIPSVIAATPAVQAPTTAPAAKALTYAGFWKRFAASIIDALILGAAGGVLGAIIGGVLLAGRGLASLGAIFALYPIGIVGSWLYYALMESSSKQGTIGKMALGIIVTDLDGNRIVFGKATGRYFGKIVSAIIVYIGFIMIAFTAKKQGLHDIMANALVINR